MACCVKITLLAVTGQVSAGIPCVLLFHAPQRLWQCDNLILSCYFSLALPTPAKMLSGSWSTSAVMGIDKTWFCNKRVHAPWAPGCFLFEYLSTFQCMTPALCLRGQNGLSTLCPPFATTFACKHLAAGWCFESAAGLLHCCCRHHTMARLKSC
jgi:hypothetical protein